MQCLLAWVLRMKVGTNCMKTPYGSCRIDYYVMQYVCSIEDPSILTKES